MYPQPHQILDMTRSLVCRNIFQPICIVIIISQFQVLLESIQYVVNKHAKGGSIHWRTGGGGKGVIGWVDIGVSHACIHTQNYLIVQSICTKYIGFNLDHVNIMGISICGQFKSLFLIFLIIPLEIYYWSSFNYILPENLNMVLFVVN